MRPRQLAGSGPSRRDEDDASESCHTRRPTSWDAAERDILDAVKSDGNRIRSRFVAKIEGTDPDAELMRNHIAHLHRRLSEDPLVDRRGAPISFERVSVGPNRKTREVMTFRGVTFTVERRSNPRAIACQIRDARGAVTEITHVGGWDETEFALLPEYVGLAVSHRARLLACYREVEPVLFRSLLADERDRRPLMMDTYRFVPETPVVFGGLVEILYSLRNQLFHGELVPDPVTSRTYEPAYHVLRGLVASIA